MAVGQTEPPAGIDDPFVSIEWIRDVGPEGYICVCRCIFEKDDATTSNLAIVINNMRNKLDEIFMMGDFNSYISCKYICVAVVRMCILYYLSIYSINIYIYVF